MGPDPEPPESEFIEPDAGTPDHDDDFQTEYYPVIGTCRALYAFDGRYWLLWYGKCSNDIYIQNSHCYTFRQVHYLAINMK